LRSEQRSQNCALVGLDDYETLPNLLHLLGSALGGSLTAFEVLWADFYETVLRISDHHVPPLEPGRPYYVLVEARGGDQDGDAALFEKTLAEALSRRLIANAAIAASVQQRDGMWAIRDDIDALASELNPMMVFDVSLPMSAAADYAAAVHGKLLARWPDTYRATTFGHLGDGNLHFLLTIGSENHDEQQQAMEIIYRELQDYGGSISAEHGIGLEKRPFLHYSRSAAEIALMQRLKVALDPKKILNPGKIFV
ncbi:MAG: FAD-binding oxidoreductase, partial [Woeseiaceae bacterium]